MDNQNMNNQQMPYQQPVYQPVGSLEEPVSLGEWIVTFLLLCIPCVNIVMMFIWAFSSTEKKSKSNFFKAYLIVALVVSVITFVMMAIFGATLAVAVNDLVGSI